MYIVQYNYYFKQCVSKKKLNNLLLNEKLTKEYFQNI